MYNQLVCNCHEDSTLLQILELVEHLHSSDNIVSTRYYWQRLQTAIYEFLDEFVPHMEEEENTFLPLLYKYFEYDELKELKDTVVEQHRMWKKKVENEKNLTDIKESSVDEYKSIQRSSSYCDKLSAQSETTDKDVESTGETVESVDLPEGLLRIPEEILLEILMYLNPVDLIAAGATNRRLRELSLRSRYWRQLPLNSWELGKLLSWQINAQDSCPEQKFEDVDSSEVVDSFYDKLCRFLEVIGTHVRRIDLSGSKFITNHHLNSILEKCVNLEILDVSYTSVSDNGLQKVVDLRLKYLATSGCRGVTDRTLKRLANSKGKIEYLNVSGCDLITDAGLNSLTGCQDSLKVLDCSGCYRLVFMQGCIRLTPPPSLDGKFFCGEEYQAERSGERKNIRKHCVLK